jgi:hypothetical protein
MSAPVAIDVHLGPLGPELGIEQGFAAGCWLVQIATAFWSVPDVAGDILLGWQAYASSTEISQS